MSKLTSFDEREKLIIDLYMDFCKCLNKKKYEELNSSTLMGVIEEVKNNYLVRLFINNEHTHVMRENEKQNKELIKNIGEDVGVG